MTTPDLRVFLQRTGGKRVAQLPWSTLAFGRAVDQVTAANILVAVQKLSDRAGDAVANAMAWRDEIGIRDDSDAEVWCGPLMAPNFTNNGVTLEARDITQWWERREVKLTVDGTEDLAQFFRAFAVQAMAEDPTPGIVVTANDVGIRGTRNVTGKTGKTVGDAMRELARDGLDYTALGRQVIVGGVEVPRPALPKMVSAHFIYDDSSPRIKPDGLLAASRAVVIGATATAGAPVRGEFGGIDGEMGLVERVFNESAIGDDGSAERAAETRWDMLKKPPAYLDGVLHLGRYQVQLNRFIPGVRVPVDVTVNVKRVNETLRLRSIDFNATAGDQGTSLTAAVQLIPLGSTDDIGTG